MGKRESDLRVIRTRRSIREAFCGMIMEMDYKDITVKALVERAMINRNTFYLHYSGTAELLKSLEDDLLSELQELVDSHMQETVSAGSVAPVFEPVLDFAAERRETFTVLFSSSEASGFFQSIQQLVHKNGSPLVRTWYRPQDPRLTDYLLNFLAWGFIGLLTQWFESGMALPKAELLSAAQRMADGASAGLFVQRERGDLE